MLQNVTYFYTNTIHDLFSPLSNQISEAKYFENSRHYFEVYENILVNLSLNGPTNLQKRSYFEEN